MWVDLDPDLYKYSKEIKISLGKKTKTKTPRQTEISRAAVRRNVLSILIDTFRNLDEYDKNGSLYEFL